MVSSSTPLLQVVFQVIIEHKTEADVGISYMLIIRIYTGFLSIFLSFCSETHDTDSDILYILRK